jgi:predicted nucleic acid-binding protein
VIVVDASALLEVLLRTTAAEAVERYLFDSRETLHAPHLLDVEVAQVLRRCVAGREIDTERGQSAIDDLADFPIRRYPHDFLLQRIWQLRNNLSAYDAAYVALAETLNARLLTRDRRFATAVGRHSSVELV